METELQFNLTAPNMPQFFMLEVERAKEIQKLLADIIGLYKFTKGCMSEREFIASAIHIAVTIQEATYIMYCVGCHMKELMIEEEYKQVRHN